MKRIVFGALVAAALAASGIVAHASLLSVDAGVLQAITHEIAPGDIVIPDESATITVTVMRFNSGRNGNELPSGRSMVSEVVPVGTPYTIVWDGGSVVPCSSVNLTNPPAEGVEGGPGTYTALADASQYFCVQTGEGTLSITVESSGGAVGTAEVNSVDSVDVSDDDAATTPADGSSSSTTLDHAAGDRCLDDGWRGRTGPHGAPYESELECVEGEQAAYQERAGESSGGAG